MTTQQKHTPTPYTFEGRTIYAGEKELCLVYSEFDHEGYSELPEVGTTNEEALATSQFIVTACNSHAALVEASQSVLDCLEIEMMLSRSSDWLEPARALKNALAIAKGGKE